MISRNAFLRGVGMSLLLVTILIWKHISTMISSVSSIDWSSYCQSCTSASTLASCMLPHMWSLVSYLWRFLFLNSSSSFSTVVTSRIVTERIIASLEKLDLPYQFLHRIQCPWPFSMQIGINYSLACLATLIASTSSESNKDSLLVIFLIAEWNETEKYSFLIQCIETSLAMKPMHVGKCVVQRCDSL